jgi:hypothetical protein
MATWLEATVRALRKLNREATTAEILREIRSLTGNRDLGDSQLLGLAGILRKHADPSSFAHFGLIYSKFLLIITMPCARRKRDFELVRELRAA